ncbi:MULTISPECIES: alpha/beta hydrolase [unclassified Arcicella]|uniref:alpha/beta hydrolase n=1 Tax=unclassified Arcicella TaxID=2644986 RepID=UPI002856B96E|nr:MULTISPECIES: alpha/beta hydrolase [unclassified Arcicella]MDR6563423.1 esterase/lipase [Arcicella sp. BE51]MDR6813465.1 esterase/lipase [Arcicella sp. BE140]MDR6824778.1 esterase/lipase [Arcicella sp. BE139]
MASIKKISARFTGLYFNLLAFVLPEKLKKDGFNLFCTPFSKGLKPHHQAFLMPAFGEILEVDGNKIQTYRWGTGSKKVLLVHGWASHSFRWKSYIKTLVEHDFTVLALDAPAHGNSTGKIMNLVIYERTLSAFLEKHPDLHTIIGHSIGGFATTYYLSRNPEATIQNAVILAAPGKVEEFFAFYVQFLGLSNKAIRLIAEQFEKELHQKPSYFSAINFAQHIKTKALIVHYRGDKSTNYLDSENLSQVWKGSTLKLTKGLGHELKSEELLQEIISFIQ